MLDPSTILRTIIVIAICTLKSSLGILLSDSILPNGTSLEFTASVDDLTIFPLDGVHSYCVEETYMSILFTEKGFAGEAYCTTWNRPWGYCQDVPTHFAGRIKSIFHPSHIRGDVILFSEPNFGLTEYLPLNYSVTPDILELSQDVRSIKANGGIPITVFERPFYQGFRSCFADANGIGLCLNDLQDLGFTSVGSIRLGSCIE